MCVTVGMIEEMLNSLAPMETAEGYDNVGALVGKRDQKVTKILVALDATMDVAKEAEKIGAELIVTHHPLMFSPFHALTDGNYEGRLIRRLTRENISLIAAHTNLDQAPGGINDTLAAACGLTDVTGEGFFRSGLLPKPMTVREFADELCGRLRTTVRVMGPEDRIIRKAGLCSGGGSDMWHDAVETGCDAFVSGEIKHHWGLALADSSVIGFECGHFATEEPGVRALAAALQKELNQVECKVRIYVSGISAYSFPRQP